MNIIFAGEELDSLRDKYTVLELDTFRLPPDGHLATAYAVLENIPITEVHRIQEFSDLHHNLMKEYRKRNWKYCEDAIEHLVIAWNGELRSFYETLYQRISLLKTQTLDDQWNGSVDKSINRDSSTTPDSI